MVDVLTNSDVTTKKITQPSLSLTKRSASYSIIINECKKVVLVRKQKLDNLVEKKELKKFRKRAKPRYKAIQKRVMDETGEKTKVLHYDVIKTIILKHAVG